jgi:predicted NUDIX family NTP pyrophosphohydrolase
MPQRSAGILLWRGRGGGIEVLLGHMGGPYWSGKDDHAWSIPKGLYDEDEEPLAAAMREFAEELGLPVPVPTERLVPLGELRQPSGKRLMVWAGDGDLDTTAVVPGMFSMEWPPRSGKQAEFPEIERAEWWSLADAETKLVRGQIPFLARLAEVIP